MKKYFRYAPYAIFTIAFLSTLGSLFFSEIMKLAPCTLCWYQRGVMIALTFVSAVGILRREKGFVHYALPLTIFGFIVALYQNLLYFDIIPEKAAPCINGVSCTDRLISLFGFLDIPQLSLIAFAILTVIMVKYKQYYDK